MTTGPTAVGWTAGQIARAAGGRIEPADAGGVPVTGAAAVDSRAARPGGLFVAVKGEHVDGYDFAHRAVEGGAVLVLADRAVEGVPTVVVHDVVAALGLVARDWLHRLRSAGRIEVVAVTGSSGKTTTKDLLAEVLAHGGVTVATPASYNNEIGLPLTVLSAGSGTRFLVLEMGARGPGHLAELAGIAPPQVSVVLNIGSAHAGEFGSRERTAQAKAELVAALEPGGLAVLNADDPLVAAMAATAADAHARTVTFGTATDADVRATDVTIDGGRSRFTLTADGHRATVALSLLGAHQVSNALAAAAVGLHAGLSVDAVAAALTSAQPVSHWRLELTERPDGVSVLNDAYNANPDSVAAALKTLVSLASGRRTWAVLGEMLELGDSSQDEHAAVGRLAARLGVDRLLVVGEAAGPARSAAALDATWKGAALYARDTDDALAQLQAGVRPGDVVLVKASRSVGLERVALALAGQAAS